MVRKTSTSSEKSAVIYLRVSTADQVENGCSLDAQEQRLTAYAASAGLDVVAIVREEGVSGTVPLAERPGGSKVAAMVSSGKVRNIVALKLDRLFRSAVDALSVTAEWDRLGVALHLADHGGQSLNTGSAMGRMVLTLFAGFAQFERDLTSERTKAALLHKRSNGLAYSPTPFGWDRDGDDLFGNQDEQDAIEQMRTWHAEGASLREIARRLNEAGVPTKQGRAWHASTVKYIIEHAA